MPIDNLDNLNIDGVVVEAALSTTGLSDRYNCTYEGAPAVLNVFSNRSGEPAVALRYQRSCAIHQECKHPNIVTQLAHGSDAEYHWAVEQRLSGGDLTRRLQNGMSLEQLLKHSKDIARALSSIHSHGYVHGNINPHTIVLDNHGIAHINDFSRAQVLGSKSRVDSKGAATTLTAAHYMAPEQAAGHPVDARADLYSLTCVVYYALAGTPPYRADSAMAVSLKHLQDPVPRLPEYLSMLQPVIDRGMAKNVEARFTNSGEFITLIDQVRRESELPDVALRTAVIDRQEIRYLTNELLTTQLDTNRQERQGMRQRRKRRQRMLLAGGVAAAVFGSVYYASQTVQWLQPQFVLSSIGIADDPALLSAWSDAQSLRQDPNQGLAAIVAAYRRVLVIAPDHKGAQTELANLASDWKAAIATALSNNNLEVAATRLSEANSVFPNDLDWAQLNTQLQNRQRAERIITSTQGLLASYGLSDLPIATAAIQSFQEVLRLAPQHPAALNSLRELSQHYAMLATNAVRSGRLNEGISLLERATAADKTVTQLDEVRKLISQATTAQAAIDDLLQQARRLRAENKLMAPQGENAAELYHRVLATDPNNAIAIQGLNEITSQVAESVDGLLLQGDLAAVEQLVNQAQGAALPEDGVNEIRRRLDAERERQATISANLAAAQEFIQAGYLTAPSQANAVARLREVQQIDPGNAVASDLLAQCAQRLAAVALDAHEFGMLEDARQYLDLALAITPEVQSWVALRESWETDKDNSAGL